ncbi:MAG: hypothetical protein JRJ54_08370 [Deltaproteobacteria bacterium]|nr:hypothetical protein [Deltaproteobacteria bacterium]
MAAYLSLMIMAYVGVVFLALSGILTLWVFLILITMPLAVKLLRQMIQDVPADADAQTAKLDTAFGILLVASLVLESLIG